MNQEERNQVEQYSRSYRRRQIWKRFVSCVACVVVFCTVYSLILPALTLEEGVYCGLEEHQHAESCYEDVLACGYEEGETLPAHEHTESCYTPQRELVCGQEESAGHVHTVECVSAQQVLICENTDPEHTHEDGCYETREVSVCGLAEGDGAHTHTEECYAETDVLTCTLNTAAETTEGTEAPAHTHDESCYEQTLVCELEEHTHSLSCYSNPDADVESADIWARSVSGATLTGVWSDDVIAVAKTQLGYQESRNNYQVMDDGVTVKGYTRYGDWYGDPYGDWSAMFVSFCLDYAGIPQSAIPQESGCSRWVQQLTQKGLYHRSGYEPKKGDLVFFDMDGDGASDRVGLVSGVTADETGHVTQFNTIEGDSANSVQRSSYTVGQSTVSGFAALPENPSAPTPTVPETTEETTGETTAETTPETTGETVPETTAETVPEESIKETMGDIQALPNKEPSAEIQAEGGTAENLQLGVQMDVEVNGTNIVKIPFTPEFTHSYTFVSKHPSNTGTCGYLYDASGKRLSSIQSGSQNVKLTCTLNAGTTYYFGVSFYRSSNFGTIPVLLTLADHIYEANEAGGIACGCGVRPGVVNDLKLNEKLNVQLNGQDMVFLPFRPEVTHMYVFEAKPIRYMYAYLYDQNLKSITSTNGRNGESAKITYSLSADTTYYFGLKYTESSSSGPVPVNLSLGNHEYVKNEEGEYACSCGVKAPSSGTCGEAAYWSFENGVLTISGSGAMYDFSSSSPVPWGPLKNDINRVIVESGVTSIGGNAFSACTNLTDVTISGSVTSIGSSAFSGCSKLTGITIPDSVTSVGSSAFSNCGSLTSVSIPGSVTVIGSYAFSECKKLTSVTISDGVTRIGNHAFSSCNLSGGITIPQSVTSIGEYAFRGSYLREIVIPSGVTAINEGTFESCSNLTSVSIPNGVTYFGDYAFGYCHKLTSITIPEKLTALGREAIYCAYLETMYWNAKNPVTFAWSIDKLLGFKVVFGKTVDTFSVSNYEWLDRLGLNAVAFEGPNHLTLPAMVSDPQDPVPFDIPAGRYYVDGSNVLYRIDDANQAHLLLCPAGFSAYTVPETIPGETAGESFPVVGVETLAFKQSSLTSLTFAAPEKIRVLRDMAFFGASELASINGKTTVSEVLSTFPNASEVGTALFDGTKISGSSTEDPLSDQEGKVTLTISTGKSAKHDPAVDSSGTFLFYTGEAASTSVTISNPDSGEHTQGNVVRVYYAFGEKSGAMNYKPGEVYHIDATNPNGSGNVYDMQVYATPIPDCYYLEIPCPAPGDTLSLNVTSTYPSPSSSGGSAAIWGGILTGAEAEALGTGLLQADVKHNIRWETKADVFPLKKSEYRYSKATAVPDGAGGAMVNSLTYQIEMSRSGTTLEGVGKDYMTSADFEDVMTLPDGVEFTDTFVKEIQEKKHTRVNHENYNTAISTPGTEYAVIFQTWQSFLDCDIVEIDKSHMVMRWHVENESTTSEIPQRVGRITFSKDILRIPNVQADKEYILHNRVTAVQHFTHSGDQVQTAECSNSITIPKGYITMRKTATSSGSQMGDPIEYTLRVENPGCTDYEKLGSIYDPLPQELYLTAEQLADMFADDSEHILHVTARRGRLCKVEEKRPVVGMDGVTEAVAALPNTGTGTSYSVSTGYKDPDLVSDEIDVEFTWADGDQIGITVGSNSQVNVPPDAAAIQRVLDNAGFVVDNNTRYYVDWCFPKGTGIAVKPAQVIEKTFTATRKDTFMNLESDARERYPSSFYSYNYFYTYDHNGNGIKNPYGSYGAEGPDQYAGREFVLTKGWSIGSNAINDETPLRQGTVLDYALTVSHEGAGSYDALPLVDHMSGAQALLVPREKNADQPWAADCTVVTANGKKYYLLCQPDTTYSHVWTSETQMADSVTVTKSASGLDTLIKWYFTGYTGTRTDTVAYQSMICPKETVPGQLIYSLSNECWLGDHQSHRLYDDLPIRYVIPFRFDKKIVDQVVDQGEDTSPGTTYCRVTEGQSVVYRLTLESDLDESGSPMELTVHSTEMYDALPGSIDGNRWVKDGNVTIQYGDGCKVQNGGSWEVNNPDGDQQYIRWKEDFSLTFRGKVHIYVTLTFPKDEGWDAYSARYGSKTLVNSFHVLNQWASVTHELVVAGKARLQKGVYASCEYDKDNYWGFLMNGQPEARFHYCNDYGNTRHLVRYYISLYNGGNARLYLTDIQDRLPRGFTLNMCDSGTSQSGTVEVYRENGDKAKRISPINISVGQQEMGDGSLRLQFHFSSTVVANYDKDRNMCFLNPGEAIVFGYDCYTNGKENSDDAACNVAAMPYYDYTGGGITVETGSETVVKGDAKYLPNDGGCTLENNGQAENYGFTGGSSGTQWLTSEVTVTRGQIKPGITKSLVSVTDSFGNVIQDPVSAKPEDKLTWRIRVDNDGADRIWDYTLTDVMQSPYVFTGDVVYSTYPPKTSSSDPVRRSYLGISIIKTDDPNVVHVKHGSYDDDWVRLTIDGGWIQIPDYRGVLLAISRDANQNAVLSLRFEGEQYSIPAGGHGELELSTQNPTTDLANKQFLNTCFITPMIQVWDNTTNKGNMTELKTPFADNARPTVRNSAPVTTTYGYVTRSVKRVTEVDVPDNTAVSSGDPNFIVLEKKDSRFRYGLSVDNSTQKPMDKLILIDSLPDLNDHTVFLENDPRFSDFKVSLADEPSFTVEVKHENGSVTQLQPDDYTLEYSTETSFDAHDWDGTTAWSSVSTGARSIRLKILDEAGEKIPPKSTVTLSFTCKVDGPIEPGDFAWNSFGYHYRLQGETNELEAAPLKVGVKIPSIPQLKKQLVDHAGQPIAAKKDQTFSFLLYQGTPLDGTYETEEELVSALIEAARAYRKITRTVPAGQSDSEAIFMTDDTDIWEWQNGQQYTLMELPTSEDFTFRGFDVSGKATYTFVYNKAEDKVITCQNTGLRWSVELTKTDATGEQMLPGAVFALYSPNEADKKEPTNRKIKAEIQRGGETWYFISEATTNPDGKITWRDLLEESYWLLEIQSPPGYHMPTGDGWLLESKNETQGIYAISIINTAGHELPNSGGTGTHHLYTMGGALLTAAAMLLLYKKKKRGKEDSASS